MGAGVGLGAAAAGRLSGLDPDRRVGGRGGGGNCFSQSGARLLLLLLLLPDPLRLGGGSGMSTTADESLLGPVPGSWLLLSAVGAGSSALDSAAGIAGLGVDCCDLPKKAPHPRLAGAALTGGSGRELDDVPEPTWGPSVASAGDAPLEAADAVAGAAAGAAAAARRSEFPLLGSPAAAAVVSVDAPATALDGTPAIPDDGTAGVARGSLCFAASGSG